MCELHILRSWIFTTKRLDHDVGSFVVSLCEEVMVFRQTLSRAKKVTRLSRIEDRLFTQVSPVRCDT
jgi:hypothetical protein